MKKIIPILAILGVGVTCSACNDSVVTIDHNKSIKDSISNFQSQVKNFESLTKNESNNKVLNKYRLKLSAPREARPVSAEILDQENENLTEIEEDEDVQPVEENTVPENTDVEISNISTLYSLTGDIDQSCDEFCSLKTNLTNAILETQNLIDKIKNNEVELTNEQRLLLSQQTKQLKDLSKQLSRATTELSINISDLNQMMLNGENLDNLSLKYLVVLDNLVNGNEMLENGLYSLNLINSMMNMEEPIEPNNGRILYGFRRNNEPPVIKDYIIDENGNMVENQHEENEQSEETETEVSQNDHALKSNIDTYGNNGGNIDTFFNTALLDNEFMYGNRNGFANGYGGFNPYAGYNYQNQMNGGYNNSTDSSNYGNNTQNRKRLRKKLTKNIDTFKDKNTPSPKTKIKNFKASVSKFMSKFSKPRVKNNVKNPIYNFNADEKEELE